MRVSGIGVVIAFVLGCGGERTPPSCEGPNCCAGTRCGDDCVDLATSPANCGACGHDCGVTGCTDGLCLPETLAIVSQAPSDLELVGDDLVFATRGRSSSTGELYRMPKTGGTPTLVYRGFADDPVLAISNSGTIVVADSNQSERCEAKENAGNLVELTPGGVVLLSPGRRCVRWLTRTPTGLAWIEDAPPPSVLSTSAGPEAFISARDDDDLATTAPAVLRGPQVGRNPQNLIATGDALLWSETNAIMQLVHGAQAPTTFAAAERSVLALAASTEEVVFADDAGLHIRSRDGTQRVDLPELGALSLAFDADFIYAGLSAIDRRTNRVLVLDGKGSRDIVQDARYLYALRDVGTDVRPKTEVIRVRKPAPEVPPLTSFACEPPLRSCEGTCRDFAIDRDNCGSCGNACGRDEICVAGGCTCAAATCGGTCVDLSTNYAHCGACDHVCTTGGECIGGVCEPVRIAGSAFSVAASATDIYYGTQQEIRRLDRQTLVHQSVQNIAAPYTSLHELAQDSDSVYAIVNLALSNGAIQKLSKSTGQITTIYPTRPDPRQIGTVGTRLVWTESESFDDGTATFIAAAKDGSGILATFTIRGLYTGAFDDFVIDSAVAGSKVYWLLVDPNGPTGAIASIDFSAATPALTLVTELAFKPISLAVGSDAVYVSSGMPVGQIVRYPVSGDAPSAVVTGCYLPRTLTVTADDTLLWFDDTSGERRIHRLATGDIFPRVLQSGSAVAPTGVGGIFLDDERLITTTPNGIYVMQR